MNRFVKGTLIASAVAGLVISAGCTPTGGQTSNLEVKCEGANACKGQGGCEGKGHDCAGKNDCKGKGWVKITKADCESKGGTVLP